MSDTPVPLSLHRSNRFGPALPRGTFAGFAAAIVTVLLIAYFGYRSLDNEDQTAALTEHTLQVIQRTDQVLSSLKDAETGQRGFLLTGREVYLAPYASARRELPAAMARLRKDTADDPKQTPYNARLDRLFAFKLVELQHTIDLRRAGAADQALALVNTDSGQKAMAEIRDVVKAKAGASEVCGMLEAYADTLPARDADLIVYLGPSDREEILRETEAFRMSPVRDAEPAVQEGPRP